MLMMHWLTTVLSVLLEGWPEALACRCPFAEGDRRAQIQVKHPKCIIGYPGVINFSRVISFPEALILRAWEEGERGNSLPLFCESAHMFVGLFCPGWEPWELLRKSSTDGARTTSQTLLPSCFVTDSQKTFVTDTWDTHLVSTQGPYKNTGVSKSFS